MNMTYQQLPSMYQSFENTMAKKKVDFIIVRLRVQPKSEIRELTNQINVAIDPSLRKALWKNYEIKSVSQNSKDESYVLLIQDLTE